MKAAKAYFSVRSSQAPLPGAEVLHQKQLHISQIKINHHSFFAEITVCSISTLSADLFSAGNGLLLREELNMKSIIVYILVALTFAFALACILLRRKNKSFEGMICKFMASFGFIGVAVVGNYIQNGAHIAYFSFILIALLFGFCGDIFLGVKEIAPIFRKKLIPIGTGFFLVGHIFYLIAFFAVYGIEWKTLIAFAVMCAAAFCLIKIIKMKIGGAFAAVEQRRVSRG